jgi:hypothetical protein
MPGRVPGFVQPAHLPWGGTATIVTSTSHRLTNIVLRIALMRPDPRMGALSAATH